MKVAASFSGGRYADVELVRRMLTAQDTDGGGEAEVMPVDGGALGWLRTSDRFAPFSMAHRSRSGNVLLVSGTPIRRGGGVAELLVRATHESLEGGTKLLTELDGAFAALLWNAAERRLGVVTDFHGLQPLHVTRDDGLFLLSTEQKGICASGVIGVEPDPAGWGAFLSFGHNVGYRTSVEGVHRVRPGVITVHDVAGGTTSERRYWQWPEPAPQRAVSDVDTASIFLAMRESVDAYLEYAQEGVVLMSGGFDSRLVLGLLRAAGLAPRALIVRHRDEHADADGRYAVRAAQGLGVEYEVRTPSRDFYSSDAYRRYLQLSEGSNTSLGLFISQVSAHIRPEHRAVWEGIAPNILKRLERNPTMGGFTDYLARACRGTSSRAWLAASYVFSPDWLHVIQERWAEALAEETASYSDDEFGVTQFSARNRARNRLGTNPYRVYANDVLPFTPALTRSFFDQVGGLSGAAKGAGDLTMRILREHLPRALDVPFCSGGKLIKGSPHPDPTFEAAKLRAQALKIWRLRDGLQRVGLYRPFTFELGHVQNELLAEVNVDDPHLNGAAVRSLLSGVAEAGPLADTARAYLFYWQVDKILSRNPRAVRIAKPMERLACSEDAARVNVRPFQPQRPQRPVDGGVQPTMADCGDAAG
jgi:hypothetical protein